MKKLAMKIHWKISIVALLTLITSLAFLKFFAPITKTYHLAYVKYFCEARSQFSKDSGFPDAPANDQLEVNKDKTIKYLYENFNGYFGVYSKSIDGFANLDNLKISGTQNFKHVAESRDTDGGLEIVIGPNGQKSIVVNRKINQVDLSRWSSSGYITAWIKIQNRKGIEAVGLKIGDDLGNTRTFNELPNLQINYPNNFDQDDVYPELKYPYVDSSSTEWTDFWLNKGWNFLPFRISPGFYVDKGKVDLSKITWFEVEIKTDENLTQQTIILDDLRIQDGLQKEKSPLNGAWYPPNGAPQYGIFDIDKINGNNVLNLLNVRQSQYPGNGEHGRMISKYLTPLNFSMRVRFKFLEVPKTKEESATTWFRLAYDFEPVIDPGHDWYGVYLSSEWKKFGLITVIPLSLQEDQDQEPSKKDILKISKNYSIEAGVMYELNLTVKGQESRTTLYKIVDGCARVATQLDYTFKRPRNISRYPFSIESTGNLKTTIYEIEIKQL